MRSLVGKRQVGEGMLLSVCQNENLDAEVALGMGVEVEVEVRECYLCRA